ncbi:MAG: HemK/PrmC family methyltransferase, partial [Anaerovoracaceae bacterium]
NDRSGFRKTENESEDISCNKPRQLKILDLCTGTGCIAIALSKAFPEAKIIASDISEKALSLARTNAEINNCSNIYFCKGNLFDTVRVSEIKEKDNFQNKYTKDVDGKKNFSCSQFDLIISNPPYISDEEYETLADEVKSYDPKLALVPDFEKSDGLEIYRRIAKEYKSFVKDDGVLVLEFGSGQKEAVLEIFVKDKKSIAKISFDGIKDLSGRDRGIILY